MTILYCWIAAAIIFLIIEMLTTTFYGLALALSSAIVAWVVYATHATTLTIFQWMIFVISTAVFAFFLPRLLSSHDPDVPQGSDRYIGEKRVVKKTGGDLKISLDGVEYLIDTEEDVHAGDKVEIIWHKGASMKVKKV